MAFQEGLIAGNVEEVSATATQARTCFVHRRCPKREEKERSEHSNDFSFEMDFMRNET